MATRTTRRQKRFFACNSQDVEQNSKRIEMNVLETKPKHRLLDLLMVFTI